MNKYHLRVLYGSHYNDVVIADGVDVNQRGDYQFWKFKEHSSETYNVAHYPIQHTIIYDIEYGTE